MSRQPAASGSQAPACNDLPPLFEHTRSINDDPIERRRTERAVRRAVAGDPEGMSYLYSRYSSGVYSYVRTIVRSRETAEDVTQQVFLKVMISLDRYDSTRAGFAAWLLRVARNAAIDAIREQRGVVVSDEVEPSGHVPEIDHRRDSLRDALGGLTEGQRTVFVLREVVGMSAGEVSERLGKKEAAVYTLHHRARVAARRSLCEMDVQPSIQRAA